MRALRAEMDAFAHTIAHDLRGPLMHVGGFADLLSEHCGAQLDDKGRQYLRTIMDSADQLGRMLAEILVLARLGRVEMRRVAIDLEKMVARVAQELGAPKATGRVAWEIEKLPEVSADPTMLRQAIVNLVSNALKFTQEREVARIRIGAVHEGKETVFCVRDNGVGFDMKDRGKLFGVFKRLHPGFPGIGLGLACVRRIIQRHGGRTWAEGVPGEGAAFYFSLPDGADAIP